MFLYEDVSGPFYRIVPLNPKVRLDDDSESCLGDARGHWEGDTLVVETRNFNDDTWLTDDGSIRATALRVTERLQRVGNQIRFTAVADDPGVRAEPWKLRPRMLTLSDVEFVEPRPASSRTCSSCRTAPTTPIPGRLPGLRCCDAASLVGQKIQAPSGIYAASPITYYLRPNRGPRAQWRRAARLGY